MKISHRLTALTALSAAALALVAGVSWYAMTSIPVLWWMPIGAR